MLLTVFDYNTVRGTATLRGTPTLSGQTLLNSFSAYPFPDFLEKRSVFLANDRLYNDGTVPAALASRAGDNGDFEVSPTTVRQNAMIIYSVGKC